MSRVLIVDDDGVACEMLGRFVRLSGFEVLTALTSAEGLALAQSLRPDVIVLDDCFPDGPNGREVLRRLRHERHPAPVIMISGRGTAETGFEAARLGAVEYLTKPVFGDALVEAVKSALKLTPTAVDVLPQDPRDGAGPILGRSPAMCRVRRQIRQISATGGGALIEGETGTGKELVARAIHACGPRAKEAFIPVNCGALSESLVESELFGHQRGAFTGATGTKPGLFDAAHRGTLFLDEISTLPLALQPALLRALESGEVRRIGDTTPRYVDVCVIAASNTDLAEAVQSGTFRQDLLYRLNTFRIVLPPLRQQPDDILLLAAHFLEERDGSVMLGLDAREALLAHTWPGNVRELRHVIQRAVTFADGGVVRAEHVAPEVWPGANPPHDITMLPRAPYESGREPADLTAALHRAGGRIGQAAGELRIGRTTMWKLMRKHGIHRMR
jgi:DNA-binding NtrC family response regulator